jgi:hypothetical protein
MRLQRFRTGPCSVILNEVKDLASFRLCEFFERSESGSSVILSRASLRAQSKDLARSSARQTQNVEARLFCHPERALRESKDPDLSGRAIARVSAYKDPGVPRLADSLGMTCRKSRILAAARGYMRSNDRGLRAEDRARFFDSGSFRSMTEEKSLTKKRTRMPQKIHKLSG